MFERFRDLSAGLLCLVLIANLVTADAYLLNLLMSRGGIG